MLSYCDIRSVLDSAPITRLAILDSFIKECVRLNPLDISTVLLFLILEQVLISSSGDPQNGT